MTWAATSSSNAPGSSSSRTSSRAISIAAFSTVIVAAPVKDPAALNVVVGVNDHRYDPRSIGS